MIHSSNQILTLPDINFGSKISRIWDKREIDFLFLRIQAKNGFMFWLNLFSRSLLGIMIGIDKRLNWFIFSWVVPVTYGATFNFLKNKKINSVLNCFFPWITWAWLFTHIFPSTYCTKGVPSSWMTEPSSPKSKKVPSKI